jgi:hypothetical protein
MGDANWEKYGSFFLVEFNKGTLLCETRMECQEDCYCCEIIKIGHDNL